MPFLDLLIQRCDEHERTIMGPPSSKPSDVWKKKDAWEEIGKSICALRRIPGPRATTKLTELRGFVMETCDRLIRTPEGKTQLAEAIRTLGCFRDPQAFSKLLEVFETLGRESLSHLSERQMSCLIAMGILCESGEKDVVVGALMRLINNPNADPQVARAAVEHVIEIAGTDILCDSSTSFKRLIEFCNDICEIDAGPRFMETLHMALRDPGFVGKEQARKVLKKVLWQATVPSCEVFGAVMLKGAPDAPFKMKDPEVMLKLITEGVGRGIGEIGWRTLEAMRTLGRPEHISKPYIRTELLKVLDSLRADMSENAVSAKKSILKALCEAKEFRAIPHLVGLMYAKDLDTLEFAFSKFRVLILEVKKLQPEEKSAILEIARSNLIPAFDIPEVTNKYFLGEALLETGDSSRFKEFTITGLTSCNSDIVIRTIKDLGEFGGPNASRVLIEIIDNPSYKSFADNIIDALVQVGTREASQKLVSIMETHPKYFLNAFQAITKLFETSLCQDTEVTRRTKGFLFEEIKSKHLIPTRSLEGVPHGSPLESLLQTIGKDGRYVVLSHLTGADLHRFASVSGTTRAMAEEFFCSRGPLSAQRADSRRIGERVDEFPIPSRCAPYLLPEWNLPIGQDRPFGGLYTEPCQPTLGSVYFHR